jgi:2-succinyl-5-enolpyruvyl-6-hydroxy-3-cyclohexene-1-carboxylate synthase
MHLQPVFDIAEVCFKKNVRNILLCPGSRCAPLTLAFTRHPHLYCKTFSDERSAGFIGLGIAQQTQQPAVLVCTSGSAAYNFAPAVAEAFFSHTPLIIFTADRPAEWIAQHDGQTIHQSEIFGKHVKKSFTLPQDPEHADSAWAINRITNEAINLALQEPRGPVHINAPFREPLYPPKDSHIKYGESVRVIGVDETQSVLTPESQAAVHSRFKSFKHVLVVAGQSDYDKATADVVCQFAKTHHVPLIVDIISNLNDHDLPVKHSDLFLGQASDEVKETLRPDLLITFGKSLISKNLKLFLRKFIPGAHWHIQQAGTAADTFKHLTEVFTLTPKAFFESLNSIPVTASFESQKQENFMKLWEVEERRASRVLNQFFPIEELTELEVVKDVMRKLPANSNLHLANSMSVRYANFIGLDGDRGIHVYSNRGTSGIDGCTSTAVGHALASDQLNILITGDLAFFYDRNAFWHNYPLPNLRVLLLNNHGGLIFNMIDGPASQPEAAEFFITRQKLNATKLCEEFDFDHLRLDNKRKLKNLVKDFFEPDGRTKIMEVETDLQLNRNTFDLLKLKIKKSYES